MKTLLFSLLGTLLLYGTWTPFQLQADIYNFSEKLSKNDTLILIIDQSACISRSVDRSKITSDGNHIFIQTEIIDGNEGKKVLQKVVYETQKDSLSIEGLLKHMNGYGTNYRENSSPFITAIHDGDTVEYYALSLTKKLGNIDYYHSIMRRIYPHEKNYQPLEPPIAE
jgi:hypothetical protein